MTAASEAALITAMHASPYGSKPRGAAEWLSHAQSHPALLEAFKPVFGASKLPHRTAFGKWLKEREGQDFGGLRLLSIYSEHAKAHRYAVETPAETQAREHKERWADLKRESESDAKLVREQAYLLRQMDKAEAEKREREEAARPGPTITIQVAPTKPAKVEYEFETKIDGAGHVTKVPLLNRDGTLREKRPETPAAPPAKPPEPEKPRTRVEEWRAKYLEHHQNITGGQGGFADPGGVVTRNISREGSGLDERTRRLELLDF